MAKALVTGGAGLIGSHIVDLLLSQGYEVRILDNLEQQTHPEGKPPWIPDEVEFIEGDVRNSEDIEKALKKVEIVFHQAAFGGFHPHYKKYVDVNFLGTINLFETIERKRLDMKKIIVASSQAIYGEGYYFCQSHGFFHPPMRSIKKLKEARWEHLCPYCESRLEPRPIKEEVDSGTDTIYGLTKYCGEKIALNFGRKMNLPVACLRYGVTYGPRQSIFNPYTGIVSIFSTRILNNLPPIVYEDGKQTRDFIYVEDVAYANLLVAQSEKAIGVFNVASGKGTTVCSLAEKLISIYGKSFEPSIPGKFRPDDVRHLILDIKRIEKLGFKPKIILDKGLLKYKNWIESHGKVNEYFSKVEKMLMKMRVVMNSCK